MYTHYFRCYAASLGIDPQDAMKRQGWKVSYLEWNQRQWDLFFRKNPELSRAKRRNVDTHRTFADWLGARFEVVRAR